jgi:hypothetical protein
MSRNAAPAARGGVLRGREPILASAPRRAAARRSSTPARRVRALVVGLGALAVLAALWSEAAWARDPGSSSASRMRQMPDQRLFSGRLTRLVRVVSPRAGALVTRRTVRVRVRVSSRARLFGAWLDGTDVTPRFGRGRRGLRTASLGRRRGLRPGVHHLVIRAAVAGGKRRDFAPVRFVVARRRPALLSLRGVRRPLTSAARAMRAAGAVGVRLRLARRADHVGLRLNGRRVRRWRALGAEVTLGLSPDDGLRYGRNVLNVTAHREQGGWDRERRVLVVRRTRPLAAAGADRRVRVRVPVRLDARRSRPARRGTRLGFRWRIVSRPRGSRARLSSLAGVRPRLRADKPGRYRVRLLVRERERRRAPRSASTGRVGGTGSDVVTVVATPDYPPIGAPFDTFFTVGSPATEAGIQVGSTRYELPTFVPLMVVLDRQTLSPVAQKTLPSGTNAAYAAFQQELSTLAQQAAQQNTHYLSILLVPPGAGGGFWSDNGFTRIDRLTWDRANPTTAAGLLRNNGGRVPTAKGLGVPGEMVGYLQLDNHGLFTPVQTPFLTFRTGQRATDSGGTEAYFTIGETTYAPPCPDGVKAGQAAFAVLALDPDSLQPDADSTGCFVVNQGNAYIDRSEQIRLNTALGRAHDAGDLVFVQSVGNPKPTFCTAEACPPETPVWSAIADQINNLGGTNDIFNRLDGSGPYALVGCLGCGYPQALESSYPETRTNGDGSLSGTLGLDQNSFWKPVVSDGGGGGYDFSMLPLVYQPASPWPQMDTVGHRAAYGWIWSHAKSDDTNGAYKQLQSPDTSWCQQIDDFRAAYCDATIPWAALQAWVQGLKDEDVAKSGGTYNGDSFTAQDFADVRTELIHELADRETVETKIALLKDPLKESNGDNQLAPNDIGHQIALSLQRNPSGSVDDNAALTTLLTTALALLSLAPDPLGPIAGVASAILAAAGQAADDSNGQPALDIEVAAEDLGAQMATRMDSTVAELDRLGDVILSDPAKLDQFANHTPGLNATLMDRLVPKLNRATQQWLWQQLLPRAWGLWKFAQPPAGLRVNDLYCTGAGGEWQKQSKFWALSDGATWNPLVGFAQDRSPVRQVWAPANSQDIHDANFLTPGGSLYDNFWNVPANDHDITHPGLNRAWFFRRAEGTWQWTVNKVADGQNPSPAPSGGICRYHGGGPP